MGLFDKLFKKNNNVETPAPAPTPAHKEENGRYIDGIWYPSYQPEEPKPKIEYPELKTVEPPKEFKRITFSEREAMIAANPLSQMYRLETQQQSFSMKSTMEWDQFKTKCKGTFVALDFETTGLDNESEEIAEICAVLVRKGKIVDSYHTYVNPNKPMPADAQAVNHITDEMLEGQPYIWQVIPDLLDFIGSNIIVAHNAVFEIKFLAQSCMRYRFKIPRKWFDSMDLKELWPGAKNRKLETLLAVAGIENENAHSATGDAEALAKFVLASIEKDAQEESETND